MDFADLRSKEMVKMIFSRFQFLTWLVLITGNGLSQGLLLDDDLNDIQPRMSFYDEGSKAELESLTTWAKHIKPASISESSR